MPEIFKRNEKYDIESENVNYLDNGNMQATINYLCDEIKPEDIFIDIGAHIGCVFIEVVDRAKPVMAYAFEPTPLSFRLLQKNCKRNLKTPYKLINKAVVDYRGEIDFFQADWGSPSNTAVDRFEGKIRPICIPCIDLNSIKFGDANLVLKVDAELSEPKIWAGLTKHIPKIKFMTMEWFNQALVETKTDRLPVLAQIRAAGFNIYDIERGLGHKVTDDYILGSAKIDLLITRE